MLKKSFATLLVLALLSGLYAGGIQAARAAGGPTIELAIANKIDVALAVGPTEVDYSTFEADLRRALKEGRAHPVPDEDVYIMASRAVSANTTAEFSWWTYDHTRPNAATATNDTTYGGQEIIKDTTHMYLEVSAKSTTTASQTYLNDGVGVNYAPNVWGPPNVTLTNAPGIGYAYYERGEMNPDPTNPDLAWYGTQGTALPNSRRLRHPYQGNISHMVSSNNGATMDFYGYPQNAYRDWQFLPNDQKTLKTFEFSIAEDRAFDALDGVGFFFNTEINGSYESGTQTMSGYLLFLQYSAEGVGNSITIYKFKDINSKQFHHSMTGTTTAGDQYTVAGYTGSTTAPSATNAPKFIPVASSPIYTSTDFSRRIRVEASPTHVRVYYNGSTTKNDASVLDPTNPLYQELTNSHLVNFNTASLKVGSANAVTLQTGSTITMDENYVGPDKSDGADYGFGPMAAYRAHGCARPTHIAFQNLTMTVDKVKTLTEVVREPEWHENTIKYLVNLNEQTIQDFEENAIIAELLARLTNDDIYYIGWGSNTNAVASADFLHKHSLKGMVVDIQALSGLDFDDFTAEQKQKYLECIVGGADAPFSYDEQIKAIADEIYRRYWNNSRGNYFLVTDNVVINVSGADKYDTADPEWPEGKWKIVHDISPEGTPVGDGGLYMTNFAGLHPWSGKYLSDLEFQFYLPGTYDIYYRDEWLTSVVAHRAPIASFEVTRGANNKPLFADTSYSPDVYAAGGINGLEHGIVNSEWSWIDLSDQAMDTPVSGVPSTLEPNHIYLVTLTVEDVFGVTASVSRQITYSSATVDILPPFADFTLTPTTFLKSADAGVSAGQKITLTNNSYDPAGLVIVSTWAVYKDEALFSGLSVSDDDFRAKVAEIAVGSLPAGQYKVVLTVNNGEKDSAPVTRSFNIVEDTILPRATANPTAPQNFSANTIVRAAFSDEGGSGFKEARVAVTQDAGGPPAGDSPLWKITSTAVARDVNINLAGNNYIYWEAWDNAGNKGYGQFGPYTLTKRGIALSLSVAAQNGTTAEYKKAGDNLVLTAEFAQVDPPPSGVVFFYQDTAQGAKLLGSAQITDVEGTPTAVWSGPPAAAGAPGQFRAEYGGDNNYNWVTATGTFTVWPSPAVDVQVGPQADKVYDAQGYLPTNITVSGAASYKIAYEGRGSTSYGPSTTPPADVGDYTLTVTTDDSNYVETSDSADFSITPRKLAITLSTDLSGAVAYDTVTLTVHIQNAKNCPPGNIEFYADNVLIDTVDSAAFVDRGNGVYTTLVGWSGMGAGEYGLSAIYVPAAADNYIADGDVIDFNIDKADQAISFAEASVNKTFGDPAFAITAGGGSASSAITYEVSSGGDVVSVDADTGEVTILGAGTAVIKAIKPGDDDYNPTTATITINVAKKRPDFGIAISSTIVLGDPIAPSITANQSNGPVAYVYEGAGLTTYGPSPNPPAAVGTYTVTGVVAETANYQSAPSSASFEIIPCSCQITGIDFRSATMEIPFHKLQETHALGAVAHLQSCGRAGHGESFIYQYEITTIANPTGAATNNAKGTLTVNKRSEGDTIEVMVTATHIPTGLIADESAQFTVIILPDTGDTYQTDLDKNDGDGDVMVEVSSLYDPEDHAGFSLEVIYSEGPEPLLQGSTLTEGSNNHYTFNDEGNLALTDFFINSLRSGKHKFDISVKNTQTGETETLTFYLDIAAGNVNVKLEKKQAALPDVSADQQKIEESVLSQDTFSNQNALDYGYDILIALIVTDIQIPTDGEIIHTNAGGKKTGAVMDISLLKTIRNTSEHIKELSSGINLIIDIPLDLRGQKSYAIAQVHHPAAGGPQYSLLPATLVNNGTQLSFMMNKFSTIAILYESAGGNSAPNNSNGGREKNDGKANTVAQSAVQPDPDNKEQYTELPFIKGYPDGLFRPGQGITRAEVAQVMYNLYGDNVIAQSGALSGFTDVDGHWAVAALAWAVEHGYMLGYEDKTIRPNANVTRAELSALIYRLAQDKDLLVTATETAQFSDIDGHWARNDIIGMAENGIVKGYADGTFRPQNKITRAEAVVMFARMAHRSREFSPGQSFADVLENQWAYIEIMNAVNGLTR